VPIYAYRCTECGHAEDVLQKMSDAKLTDCPACGKSTYAKQVTAAGFQLKGSGWYVTDFRNNGDKPSTVTAPSTTAAVDTAPAASSASTGSASDTKSGDSKSSESKASDSKPSVSKLSESKPSSPAPAATGSN
jgi:putative FmdB family regulatory protein